MNAHAWARALGRCMLPGLARCRGHGHGRGHNRRVEDGRRGGAVGASVGRRRSARACVIGCTCGDMRVVVVGKRVVVGLGSDRNRRVGGW